MTSTTLSGLGMAEDLDFGVSGFGEPAIFPGGISFGSSPSSTASSPPRRQEHDRGRQPAARRRQRPLDIQGTLVPEQPVQIVGTVAIAPRAGGIRLSRAQPFDWKAQGFLAGQPVHISGLAGTWTVAGFGDDDPTDTVDNTVLLLNGATATASTALRTVFADDVPVTATVPVTITGGPSGGTVTRTDAGTWGAGGFVVGQLVTIDGLAGSWRLQAISANGKTLTLARGAELPSLTGTRMVSVPGPHGGLTVVHGGGNLPLEIEFSVASNGTSLTRLDGLSWADAGFVVGQRIAVEGAATRIITGFANAACPYSDPFPGCGVGSVLLFAGPAVSTGTSERSVHVAEPKLEQLTAPMEIHTSELVTIGGNSSRRASRSARSSTSPAWRVRGRSAPA